MMNKEANISEGTCYEDSALSAALLIRFLLVPLHLKP